MDLESRFERKDIGMASQSFEGDLFAMRICRLNSEVGPTLEDRHHTSNRTHAHVSARTCSHWIRLR